MTGKKIKINLFVFLKNFSWVLKYKKYLYSILNIYNKLKMK